ncbi:hypothetical protein RRG08_065437 [Elysia crispata]|uniref:Uncharacterized protein n=1 Tax=Elysia crispata TaxID=231223 RepID=A0AAE1DEP0_9GAST|nr:hypothetical protein RRG08_065437 [Elysia crispata]
MEGADQTYHHHTGRDRVCVGDTEDGGRRSDLPSSYWQGQSLCRGHRGWRAQIRLTIIILAGTEFVDRVCVGDTEDGGRRSDLPSSYWQRQSLCRGHRGWGAQIRLTIIILAETEFV